AQTGGDDHCDRLNILTAAKRDAFRFHIDALTLSVGPKIEIRSLRLFDKTIAQLAAVCCIYAEMVSNRVVNRKKLPADLLVLLQHQSVQAKLVAPKRRRQSRRPSADNQNVVHSERKFTTKAQRTQSKGPAS